MKTGIKYPKSKTLRGGVGALCALALSLGIVNAYSIGEARADDSSDAIKKSDLTHAYWLGVNETRDTNSPLTADKVVPAAAKVEAITDEDAKGEQKWKLTFNEDGLYPHGLYNGSSYYTSNPYFAFGLSKDLKLIGDVTFKMSPRPGQDGKPSNEAKVPAYQQKWTGSYFLEVGDDAEDLDSLWYRTAVAPSENNGGRPDTLQEVQNQLRGNSSGIELGSGDGFVQRNETLPESVRTAEQGKDVGSYFSGDLGSIAGFRYNTGGDKDYVTTVEFTTKRNPETYVCENGKHLTFVFAGYKSYDSNTHFRRIDLLSKATDDTDTDKDGLSDRYERYIKTDINKADTDGDGKSDKEELTGKSLCPVPMDGMKKIEGSDPAIGTQNPPDGDVSAIAGQHTTGKVTAPKYKNAEGKEVSSRATVAVWLVRGGEKIAIGETVSKDDGTYDVEIGKLFKRADQKFNKYGNNVELDENGNPQYVDSDFVKSYKYQDGDKLYVQTWSDGWDGRPLFSQPTVSPEKAIAPAKDKYAPEKINPEKTEVKDPSNLTEQEKKDIADKIKKTKGLGDAVDTVTVNKDGSADVIFKDGTKETIPADKLVKTTLKAGTKVQVAKTDALTQDEMNQVKEAVAKANPGLSKENIQVSNNGTVTLTNTEKIFTGTLTPEQTIEGKPQTLADTTKLVDPAKTKVDNPQSLSDTEKKSVEEAIKTANSKAPIKSVTVDGTGKTTVTFTDDSTTEIPANKTVEAKKAPSAVVKEATVTNGVPVPADTKVIEVSDSTKITATEPVKGLTVDENGNLTGTPTGVDFGAATETGTVEIPVTVTSADGKTETKTVKVTVNKSDADKTKLTDPTKTKVDNTKSLTEDEKAKVKEAVKAANPNAPIKEIVVDADGTTHVTFNDGSKAEIPAEKTVEGKSDADKTKLTDPTKTKVDNTKSLTEDEKAKVKEAVKAANPNAPIKEIVVDADGTTHVTFNDGSKAEIPAEKTVEGKSDAEKNPLTNPTKTKVDNTKSLTEDEKAKVKEAVKAANPNAPIKEIVVDADGTTHVTFEDGSKADIPGTDTVEAKPNGGEEKPKSDAEKNPLTNPKKVQVGNTTDLTADEKKAVEEAVKTANPNAPIKSVTVDADGTTHVTFNDGTTADIPGIDTVEAKPDTGDGTKPGDDKKISDSVTPSAPALTPVKDPKNLTDDEKNTVKSRVCEANKGNVEIEKACKGEPAPAKVEVGNDGTVTITYTDSSKSTIPASKTVAVYEVGSALYQLDPPAKKVPVGDPSNLTDAEKDAVKKAVCDANKDVPEVAKACKGEDGAKVEVGKDGSVTVTYADGSTDTIAGADTVMKKEETKPGSNNGSGNGQTGDIDTTHDNGNATTGLGIGNDSSNVADTNADASDLPATGLSAAGIAVALISALLVIVGGVAVAIRRRQN